MTSFVVAFFVLSLGAQSLAPMRAEAQTDLLAVYAISGHVFDETGNPLAGANVDVNRMDARKSENRTTTAGEDGSYEFRDLPAGTYTLQAYHPCCLGTTQEVTVDGATLEAKNVDFYLKLPNPPISNETATISGTVRDMGTGAPLGGAPIHIDNSFDQEQPEPTPASDDRTSASPIWDPGYHNGYQYFVVWSASDGSYSVQVNVGSIDIVVDLEGYDIARGHFDIAGDRTIDIPMQPSTQQTVRLSGTVRSTDGTPIAGASINVNPDYRYQQYCDGDVCVAREETAVPVSDASGGSGSSSGDFWYEPRNYGYAWTQSDANGFWEVKTTPGKLQLSAWADRYLQYNAFLEVNEGEDRRVDIAMEPIPPDTVNVFGTIVDAEDGSPIAFAQVNLENQKWGHYNWTQTDEKGRYSFWTKPGYTIVSVYAYRQYWVPCDEVMTAEDSTEPASGLSIRPPERDCSDRQREHDYLPRIASFVGTENEVHEFSAKLLRAPPPDAVFQGWVVNETGQKGIADARVSFYNEITRDWGAAVTDGDGSFKIEVRAGYYTIRAYAEGYYDGVLNTEIASGETSEIAIELMPGKRGSGYCCVMYARGAAMEGGATGSMAAGPAGADGAKMEVADEDSAGAGGLSPPAAFEPPSEDELAFRGSGGGLGEYDPSAVGQGTEGGAATPGAGLFVILFALAGLALVRRRSQR